MPEPLPSVPTNPKVAEVALVMAAGKATSPVSGALESATDWPPASVPLLARLLASPPYWAVMARDPSGRLLVVNTAVPPASVASPSNVAPSLNVTVPVGEPEPVTAAVNVIDVPSCAGLALEDTLVAEACFTTWFTAAEAALPCAPSPAYA